MKCPFCNHTDTQVKDSRPSEDGGTIRRRRFCPECNSRFTTFERVQLRELFVIKTSGDRKPFDREKIARSLHIALRKRDVDSEEIEKTINRIVQKLESRGDSEVTTHDIGELVMEELAALDKVGYIRYASVYRNFAEARDFEEFVEQIGIPELKKEKAEAS
ncbi:MAG: transcriptional regulator NrdR [Rickettsiales bacterium]|nr:transcriptional regulator NrdR [Rickettsiales bacterium]